MSEKEKYKICIIGNSLSGGGAEKAHSVLSNSLNKSGIEIHNIIFEDKKPDYEFSGKLFVLGLHREMNYLTKIKKLKTLNQYLKKNKFDFIIDFRFRGTWYMEWILVRYIFGKTKYIPRIASFNTDLYFTANRFVAKSIYKKAFFIHSLSEEMEQKIRSEYGYTNIKTISNSIEYDKIKRLSEEPIDFKFDYIISVGRMASDNVKQHDIMIEAYSKSILPEKNIKLLFLGNGENRIALEKLATAKNLSDKIIFKGFQPNPFKYLKNALYLLLTSKYEGFPNVILESFACEIPVVSYDCKSGPNEIIENYQNGILVENQNIEELIKAMNLMVEDKQLYQTCKSNTLKTALQFSPEIIGQQWLELMNIKPNHYENVV